LLYLRQGTPFPSCSAPFYTGGTRGIGRAIAELLAEEGCNVALCARHEAAVDETVMALTGKGVKSWGGVADAKALRAWVAEAAAALGGLGIFVANVSALAQSMDEDSWRRSQEIDIMGTVAGVEAAIPLLEQSTAGAIVVVGTTGAIEIAGPPRPYASARGQRQWRPRIDRSRRGSLQEGHGYGRSCTR
jgi:3-oxoacyl-[acyl-carrier protein] reductase